MATTLKRDPNCESVPLASMRPPMENLGVGYGKRYIDVTYTGTTAGGDLLLFCGNALLQDPRLTAAIAAAVTPAPGAVLVAADQFHAKLNARFGELELIMPEIHVGRSDANPIGQLTLVQYYLDSSRTNTTDVSRVQQFVDPADQNDQLAIIPAGAFSIGRKYVWGIVVPNLVQVDLSFVTPADDVQWSEVCYQQGSCGCNDKKDISTVRR
jgi:hypothetical protein